MKAYIWGDNQVVTVANNKADARLKGHPDLAKTVVTTDPTEVLENKTRILYTDWIGSNMKEIEQATNNPDDFVVSVSLRHQGKYYGSYATIPPEKQNMEYVKQQTSGLSFAIERKIKELLLAQPE